MNLEQIRANVTDVQHETAGLKRFKSTQKHSLLTIFHREFSELQNISNIMKRLSKCQGVEHLAELLMLQEPW